MTDFLWKSIVVNVVLITIVAGPARGMERQLTFAPRNHALDNNDNFSPDDQWLVFDTRTEAGGIQAGRTIEKVHVRTAEIVVIYSAPNATDSGPGVGAASYHPLHARVVFIHGLLNHSVDSPYAQWRRFGMLLDEQHADRSGPIDARNMRAPFIAGALRGGTHRHEFSADGNWVGFTYNDELMVARGERFNLRTIGVTQLNRPVQISGEVDGASFHGSGMSALVVAVTPDPRPGSDDISRAAWDSWIGIRGYRDKNGSMQRGRAFLGTVRSAAGLDVAELFVVDIPDDISAERPHGLLAGTATELPQPPAGASQRRLTDSTQRKFPGFSGNVRSSPDGSLLACLAKDDAGIDQVVIASPLDGKPRPLTNFVSPVQSDVRWHPDGRHVCFAQGNSIVVANPLTGAAHRVTDPADSSPFALVWSRKGDVIAFNRQVADSGTGETFTQVFTVNVGAVDRP